MKSSIRSNALRVALVASVFSISTSGHVLAQSQSLEASRNLVTTGKSTPAPGALRSQHVAADATAIIDLGTAAVVTAYSRQGSFDRVGLRHDQTIDIAVQYSTAAGGQVVTVEPLDGGQIIAPAKNLVVGNDGAIHFKFRAGHSPGIYQVALRKGGQELGLQFWVRDDEHPGNNPRVINPGN
jgi:hypothetical protein